MCIGCNNLSMLWFFFNWSWTVCILQHIWEWYFWLEAHYELLLNIVDQYHFCGWLTVCSAIERNESVYTRILC